MVLGASFEFDKSNNPEIIERPSDNEEVPQVIINMAKYLILTDDFVKFH